MYKALLFVSMLLNLCFLVTDKEVKRVQKLKDLEDQIIYFNEKNAELDRALEYVFDSQGLNYVPVK